MKLIHNITYSLASKGHFPMIERQTQLTRGKRLTRTGIERILRASISKGVSVIRVETLIDQR